MLFVANCARFFATLLETTFRLGSLRLCVELRQRRLPKLMETGDVGTCVNSDVTWSTESCLRSIFLLSPAGLSFKSIDFCLRNRFFALLGWNCCRMVDIWKLYRVPTFTLLFGEIFSWFLLQSDIDIEQFLRALCKFPDSILFSVNPRLRELWSAFSRNSDHANLNDVRPGTLVHVN